MWIDRGFGVLDSEKNKIDFVGDDLGKWCRKDHISKQVVVGRRRVGS